MNRADHGSGGQRPPAWSRALTYFGFDAVPAERAVARLRARRVRAGHAPRSDASYPRHHSVSSVRQRSEIAGHVAGGVVILAVALFVLFAANTASRIVTSSESSADASPSTTPPPTVSPVSVSVIQRDPVTPDLPPGDRPPRGLTGGAKDVVPAAALAPAVGREPTMQTPKAVPSTAVRAPSNTSTPQPTAAPTTQAPPTAEPPSTVSTRTVVAAPLPTTPPSCTAKWYVLPKQIPGGFGVEAQVSAGQGGVGSWTVGWDKLPDHNVVGSFNAAISGSGSSIVATGTALAPGEVTKFWIDFTGTPIPQEGTLDCRPA